MSRINFDKSVPSYPPPITEGGIKVKTKINNKRLIYQPGTVSTTTYTTRDGLPIATVERGSSHSVSSHYNGIGIMPYAGKKNVSITPDKAEGYRTASFTPYFKKVQAHEVAAQQRAQEARAKIRKALNDSLPPEEQLTQQEFNKGIHAHLEKTIKARKAAKAE